MKFVSSVVEQGIVRRVEAMFALADRYAARLALARAGGAVDAVPQEPTDEPAEKLLERIRSK